MFDCGMDYFSSWQYFAIPGSYDVPSVSYYVAKGVSSFAGSKLCKTERTKSGLIPGADVNVSAAYNDGTDTLRVMAYNYKNSLQYLVDANVALESARLNLRTERLP